MAKNSKIEWCHHTFNGWRGCTKVSDGCKNCYAETFSHRNPKVLGMWGPMGNRVIAAESYWQEPLKWNHDAQEAGERRRVFCASLSDIFEGPETCKTVGEYDKVREARQRIFRLSRRTPWLDWLFLTKRPHNIPLMMSEATAENRPHTDFYTLMERQHVPNWWFGTSVESQEVAGIRVTDLLRVPAVVLFLSCEPLLSRVTLRTTEGHVRNWLEYNQRVGNSAFNPMTYSRINWVIVGGESGHGARPMHPDWARLLRDQCVEARVPFHYKQWGEWSPIDMPWEQESPQEPRQNEQWLNLAGGMGFHGEQVWRMRRVGKNVSGRLLDGVEWNQFPEVTH